MGAAPKQPWALTLCPVASPTPCVGHLLPAKIEDARNHTGAGTCASVSPPLTGADGSSPRRDPLGRARLGSSRGECARLGPAPCGRSQAGQPAAPWRGPLLLGRPGGWARVAPALGRAQPGQPAVGLRASGTGPSRGTGAHTDSAGSSARLAPGCCPGRGGGSSARTPAACWLGDQGSGAVGLPSPVPRSPHPGSGHNYSTPRTRRSGPIGGQ